MVDVGDSGEIGEGGWIALYEHWRICLFKLWGWGGFGLTLTYGCAIFLVGEEKG